MLKRPSLPIARRSLLLGMPALMFAGGIRTAFAYAPTDQRFVVVLLRGAMDGLSVVAPYGSPQLAGLRGGLLLPEPGQDGGLLDLGGQFGLHPSLAGLHGMYTDGDLLIWHAVAGPYRSRSHFDAQDMMESGADQRLDSGWLNRAASAMPSPASDSARPLVAGLSMPLLMEGSVAVSSYAPDKLADKMPAALWGQVALLSASDPIIGPAVQEGLASRIYDGGVVSQMQGPTSDLARFSGPAGQLLAAPDGPRIAALEISGWDTHQAQKPRLAQTLKLLDDGMVALKSGLGPAWSKTAVLVITEFGRTAHANGTNGTDHGTASACFVLGGAVAGGRVGGTWPGLADNQLFENRDLDPTTDMWSVAKGLLGEHMGVRSVGFRTIFPGSAADPSSGLIRKA